MYAARRLFRTNRTLAGLLIAVALAVKLLAPAGYMPGIADGQIVLSVCRGMSPMATRATEAGPHMMHGDADSGDQSQGGDQPPCAFSGLSTSSLAAADPVLLAAAILFVVALRRRVVAPPPLTASTRLRPPLRGPPAPA